MKSGRGEVESEIAMRRLTRRSGNARAPPLMSCFVPDCASLFFDVCDGGGGWSAEGGCGCGLVEGAKKRRVEGADVDDVAVMMQES